MTLPAPGSAAVVVDRASARRFVDEHVIPRAGEWEREQHIPDPVLDAVAAAGLWAPFLPERFGGRNQNMVTFGEVHEEVGRGCSSLRSLLTVHSMVSWAVWRFGTEGQRADWVPALASGAALGAFCLTEPGAGSDAAGISSTVVPDGDGWRLDGHKKWITNGQRADVLLVFARLDSAVVALLVPRDADGVHVIPMTDVLGTRAAMLAGIRFQGVRLPAEALLGPRGFTSGMVLTGVLDIGRYSVACGSVGIVQGCLEASADYSDQRVVAGSRLSERQLIRAHLSDMVTDARAGRLLCAEAGRLKDAADPRTVMATWIAKYFASTAAARHASSAVQVHGANGFGPEYPVARMYRDAKVMEIIEGSNEIQRETIADEAYREVR
ncbi:MAG: acyl-CoA dehydrogenase family protein [Kineosporiaceae bacterium]